MESILNALWHGNLRPSEQFLFQNPDHKKLADAWLRLRKKLEDHITDEATRALLHKLETAEMNLAESAEIAAFRMGYALGVSMTEEVAQERAAISKK